VAGTKGTESRVESTRARPGRVWLQARGPSSSLEGFDEMLARTPVCWNQVVPGEIILLGQEFCGQQAGVLDVRCWSQVEQPSLPGGADGGTADGGDEGWALRVAQLWMPELLRFGWLCVMLLQKTALEGPRSAQLWRFPSLAPNSPQLAPGRRGPAVTTATGPAEEAGPGRSFALLRAPRSWRPSPPTALSLEAASGASGSYSVSGSPVSAPASHQVGVLGLMASFTPLRVAGPSQGSTETLAPGSARSSPFEEQRRRVKEDGKVNAPALRRAARGRGAAAGGGLEVLSGRLGGGGKRLCRVPRAASHSSGCQRWVGLARSSSSLWGGWSWPELSPRSGEGTTSHPRCPAP